MKRVLVCLLALSMCCLGGLPAAAAAGGAVAVSTVAYMTVSDAKGNIVVAGDEIEVREWDGDGMLTVNDAMLSLHRDKHPNGSAGFASEQSATGLVITRLWGDESGKFGCFVNGQIPTGLDQKIMYGDYIQAFIYTDTENYADTYACFDINRVRVNAGDRLTLTLSYISAYDGNSQPIYTPLSDAVITFNGEAIAQKTDEKGMVTVRFDQVGRTVISAISDTVVLVNPICVATVSPLPTVTTPTSNEDDSSANGIDRGLILGATLGVALSVIAGVYIYWVIKRR